MTLDQIEELIALPVEDRSQREATREEEFHRRRREEGWMSEKDALAMKGNLRDFQRLADLDISVEANYTIDTGKSLFVSGGAFLEKIDLGPIDGHYAVIAKLVYVGNRQVSEVEWSLIGIDRFKMRNLIAQPIDIWDRTKPVVVFAYLDIPRYTVTIQNVNITSVPKDQRVRLL